MIQRTSVYAILMLVGLTLLGLRPAPAFSAFSEILTQQNVATQLEGSATVGHLMNQIAFANNKTYLAFQSSRAGNPSILEYTVAQFDYETGLWKKTLAATAGVVGGNTIHSAPGIFRNPATGRLELYYGSNDCMMRDNLGYPCYRVSTNPDDITVWEPEQRVPNVSYSVENIGGFTQDGNFHLFGAHGAGNYLRRDPQGNWSGATFLHNVVGSGTNDQASNIGGIHVVGNSIHIVWRIYQPDSSGNFSGAADSLYYARSTDGGITWRSADGTISFTRAQGLSQVSGCLPRTQANGGSFSNPPCQFPAPFKVYSGYTSTIGHAVRVLSDGNPVIANFSSQAGTSFLHRWSGSSWVTTTVDAAPHSQPTMQVSSTDEIVIYALRSSDGQGFEFTSADRGAAWQKTGAIITGNPRWLISLRASPPGQKERILLAWDDRLSTTINVKFWDKPRGTVAPPPLPSTPAAPRNLRISL